MTAIDDKGVVGADFQIIELLSTIESALSFSINQKYYSYKQQVNLKIDELVILPPSFFFYLSCSSDSL